MHQGGNTIQLKYSFTKVLNKSYRSLGYLLWLSKQTADCRLPAKFRSRSVSLIISYKIRLILSNIYWENAIKLNTCITSHISKPNLDTTYHGRGIQVLRFYPFKAITKYKYLNNIVYTLSIRRVYSFSHFYGHSTSSSPNRPMTIWTQ